MTTTNDTERLTATESRLALLADLTGGEAAMVLDLIKTLGERVAYLEHHSEPFNRKRKEQEHLALVEKIKNVRTVEQWKALHLGERELFRTRAYDDQIIAMVKDASPEDRRAIVQATGNRPGVVFTLAIAPRVVEVTATASVQTKDVTLPSEREADRLREMGLPVARREQGMFNDVCALKRFTMDRGTLFVDAAAWAERVALDPVLAHLVFEGRWIQVRHLADDEARESALKLYNERLALARDFADSRLQPKLPEV